MGCSPKFGEKEDAATAKSSEDDEFCTSIDTTDSIDEITFADSTKTGGSGSWNPFKKYTNVAKTEASVPDEDVELGMKSKVDAHFLLIFEDYLPLLIFKLIYIADRAGQSVQAGGPALPASAVRAARPARVCARRCVSDRGGHVSALAGHSCPRVI